MKALLFAFFTAAASAQTFTVAGVVSDVAHGSPLSRARVTLLGGRGGKLAAITGADGRFSFDVPEGKYNLLAEHNEWRIQFGNVEPMQGFGSAIVAGPGQDTSHLKFSWYAPAAIFGTITDERGEPVRSATVQIIRSWVVVGRRRVLAGATVRSDDRGQYRFGPLPAGTYYVIASGRPWFASQGTLHRVQQDTDPIAAYPTTYYPATTDSTRAGTIVLRSSQEEPADISLRPVQGVAIHVRCPGSGVRNDECRVVPTLSMHGIGGVEISQPNVVRSGLGVFSGTPPGRYTVRVSVADESAAQVVDVGAGDLTVGLTLQPRIPVTGTVALKNGAPFPRSGIYVAFDNETTGRSVGAPISEDGAFTLRYTGGARFRVRLYGSVPLAAVAMSVDGVPVNDDILDLTEKNGARLKITASNELGRLKGFVTSGGRPAPAVLAVLVPAKGASSPSDYRGYQTDSDASFDYENIPAGDYLLFAVDQLDLEYTNPDVVKRFLPSASPVHISAHAILDRTITLMPANSAEQR